MIRVGREALVDGRRIIGSHPSRASAATEKVRLRRHRRVTRSRGHDPFVTPPDDRCGSRRHAQFVLASDRADDGRQEDGRFDGTPPRKDGYGKLITVDPEEYPSRLVNRSRYSVEAPFRAPRAWLSATATHWTLGAVRRHDGHAAVIPARGGTRTSQRAGVA